MRWAAACSSMGEVMAAALHRSRRSRTCGTCSSTASTSSSSSSSARPCASRSSPRRATVRVLCASASRRVCAPSAPLSPPLTLAQRAADSPRSAGIQIIFYFLQGNCMIAFAFMLSSIFSSSRTAIVVAFLYVFGSGLIGELLLKVRPCMAGLRAQPVRRSLLRSHARTSGATHAAPKHTAAALHTPLRRRRVARACSPSWRRTRAGCSSPSGCRPSPSTGA